MARSLRCHRHSAAPLMVTSNVSILAIMISAQLVSVTPSPPLPSLSQSVTAGDTNETPVPTPTTVRAKPAKETGLKHMIAGSIAGMAAKTILQPLDLIKVRLQVQDGRGPNEYRGVVNAIQRVVREEGFVGLYRGLTPNLVAAGVSWGTYFFSYNQFKDFFKRRVLARLPLDQSNVHVQLGPLTHLSCAAASGVLATTLTNPIVMVKTRLQLQGKESMEHGASRSRHYRGMTDAFQRIVREEGFFSLYRGLGPSLVLVSNGSLQFMAYEELKELCVKYLVGTEDKLSSHHYFLMGGAAKIFSATVTYPFAVTRSRLFARKPVTATMAVSEASIASVTETSTAQSINVKRKDAKYDGMLDAMRSTWRNEGWRGFYRGLTPQLLKTAPSSAITFLIYETIVKLWSHSGATTAQTAASSTSKLS